MQGEGEASGREGKGIMREEHQKEDRKTPWDCTTRAYQF